MKYLPQPDPAVDANNCGLVKYSIPLANYDNEFVTRVDWNIRTNHNLYGILSMAFSNPPTSFRITFSLLRRPD